MFCPTNFNQINTGYTEAQVVQLCGKPAQQETKEVKPGGPQEWDYFIKQSVSTVMSYQTVGTLKMQITFDGSGHVINLNVNGIGVGGTAICGALIQLNSSTDQVKAACGAPAYINTPTSTSEQPSTQVTTYTYMSNPPAVLTFENGVLTKKE